MDMDIKDKNVEKQQQLAILEEDEDGMSVPNWLVDVLKWITRMEMANSSMSFSCKVFKQLCWPKLHENVKPRIVRWLLFDYESDKFGNIYCVLKDGHNQIIKIASTPMPEYIHGFQQIIIRFLENQVLEFFKNIALDEIYLSFNTSMQKFKKNENEEQFTLMRNLLTILANSICGLQIHNKFLIDPNRFTDFYQIFPMFIDQMPYLDVRYISIMDLDILFDWLMKPLSDGRQKILLYHINFDREEAGQQQKMELRFINRINEEFLHSTERKNFLIKLEHGFTQFSLQNEQTGEILNLYQEMYTNKEYNFLARFPKKRRILERS